MDEGQEEIFQNLTSSDLFSLLNYIDQPLALADESGKLSWYSIKFKELFPAAEPQASVITVLELPDELNSLEIPERIESNLYSISVKRLNDELRLLHIRSKEDQTKLQNERIKLFKNSAHDLNNILTSIVNSASLLLIDEERDSKTRKMIENLESNSLRAVDIVDSILTEEIGATQTKRKIKLNALIEELQNSLKSITPSNVSISYDIGDDLEIIMGNYSDLYRVFLNLCINSSEAIEGSGKIIVKAENVSSESVPGAEKKNYEKYVKVSVSDNGSGIEENNIDKVFDSDFSTKNKDYNSGLGLSIVKEIISNHDGIIDIESDWGIGTTITIYLPSRSELIPKNIKNKSSRKILIADDENSILELLLDLFQSYGYEVLEAKDGRELVDLVEAGNAADLYIIDRKMPEPDGLECIKIIRDKGLNEPIILTTGSLGVGDNPELQKLDITQILVKPYDFEELLKLVDGLLV